MIGNNFKRRYYPWFATEYVKYNAFERIHFPTEFEAAKLIANWVKLHSFITNVGITEVVE